MWLRADSRSFRICANNDQQKLTVYPATWFRTLNTSFDNGSFSEYQSDALMHSVQKAELHSSSNFTSSGCIPCTPTSRCSCFSLFTDKIVNFLLSLLDHLSSILARMNTSVYNKLFNWVRNTCNLSPNPSQIPLIIQLLPGVSSIINSTPVIVFKCTYVASLSSDNPSFISSLGSCTTEDCVCDMVCRTSLNSINYIITCSLSRFFFNLTVHLFNHNRCFMFNIFLQHY